MIKSVECDSFYIQSLTVTVLVGHHEEHPARGFWFVGGDNLTEAMHVLQLQLSLPSPSPINPEPEWWHSGTGLCRPSWKMVSK